MNIIRFDNVDSPKFNADDFTISPPSTFQNGGISINTSFLKYKNRDCYIRFPPTIAYGVRKWPNSWTLTYQKSDCPDPEIENFNIFMHELEAFCKASACSPEINENQFKPFYVLPKENGAERMYLKIKTRYDDSGLRSPLAKVYNFAAKKISFHNCINSGATNPNSKGTYIPIVHIRGIYFGAHGSAPYKASVQMDITEMFFDQRSSLTSLGQDQLVSQLGSLYVNEDRKDVFDETDTESD